MVRTAHGLLPIPAPAVSRLLAGFAVRADDGMPGERVTPTGAAILRYLAPEFGSNRPAGVLNATGIGLGSRDLPGIPNVLHVISLTAAAAEPAHASVVVIEFDIDDQSPEELAVGLDRLRLVPGVVDVVTFQGLGKKGRWVQAVRVIADPGYQAGVMTAAFDQTATLGLRLRDEARVVLARETMLVENPGGPVRVKVADRPSGRTAKAESDDIAELAHTAEARARLGHATAEHALRGGITATDAD
jgi:uncharacterized protein (DUF111 family)